MFFVRYHRDDLINGEAIEMDFSIVTGSLEQMHAQAVALAKYRPTATGYQLFSGSNLRNAEAVSLKHAIPR